MEIAAIRGMGGQLKTFLQEFDDCFSRSEPREHLRTYVDGQLSNLPRKSVEPMALAAGVKPRTLQSFLSHLLWDEQRMRDRIAWIVARDHASPSAIGVIDESGNPKKGQETAGVARQWCGRNGKVDNCVVGVHLSYVSGDFQTLVDSQMFLPEDWANDPERRRQHGIPDDVVFKTKPQIALEEIRRALANGLRVSAWTFDEGYGRSGAFLDELESLGQDYVGEIPSDFVGWVKPPRVLSAPRPAEWHQPGRKRQYPRLARQSLPACEVRHLARFSPVFTDQPWVNYRIKDGENGPIVWQVKHALFYRKQGPRQLPGPAHTLLVARNAVKPDEVKYFLSARPVEPLGWTVQRMLAVGFSRWPIERCFELGKGQLGLDHFEVRSWRGIHRHWYVSQVSQLFCAREHQRLREKNDTDRLPDGRTGPRRRLDLDTGAGLPAGATEPTLPHCRRADRLLPTPKSPGPPVAHENHPSATGRLGHRRRPTETLYSRRFMNYLAL